MQRSGQRQLDSSQEHRAVEVLASAFLQDPLYVRVFPSEDDRHLALLRLFSAVVGYARTYGEVLADPTARGVACWLTPGNTEVTVWRMVRTGLRFQRAFARFTARERSHLRDALAFEDRLHTSVAIAPHWYLWALGVEPSQQRAGIGSSLMRPVLYRADQDGVPCYLDAHTAGTVRFYQKHGFVVRGEGTVPHLGVRVWAMVRDPRE